MRWSSNGGPAVKILAGQYRQRGMQAAPAPARTQCSGPHPQPQLRAPRTHSPCSGRPNLTPPRNAPGRSATSAGPAPPAPPGAGSGRSCGTSPAAPGCSHRCPRWASAPEAGSGGSARLRAESGTAQAGDGPGPRRAGGRWLEPQGSGLMGTCKSPTPSDASPEVLKHRHLRLAPSTACHKGAAIFPQVGPAPAPA